MDRYAWLLEKLREDGCRRLRTFVPDGQSTFRTWLAVVARRLCYDFDRHRYGRVRGDGAGREESRERRGIRQRLADLVGTDVDLTTIKDQGANDPEYALRLRQLNGALDRVLSTLQSEDRLVLRLRLDDELSARQVAEIVSAVYEPPKVTARAPEEVPRPSLPAHFIGCVAGARKRTERNTQRVS